MNNQLLICPDCQEKGTRNILGSVDSNGHLVVMRYRQREERYTTIESVGEYMVICHCGFGTAITQTSNGHVKLNLPSPPQTSS